MTNSASALLFNDQTGAGAGVSVSWGGGRGVAVVDGTFGGTVVTIQYQGPAATWLDVKAMDAAGVQTTVSLAAPGMIGFELPPGNMRGVATGGAPVTLKGFAYRVPY